jgi:hypothetical protein
MSVQQVLAALVPRDQGSISLNAPSTGFPAGTGWQVNIVQDDQHLTALLAQSPQFTIKAPVSSSSSGSSTGSSTLTVSS